MTTRHWCSRSSPPAWLRRGFALGRIPLAINSRPHGGREANPYFDSDFYGDVRRSAYRPRYTIERLQQAYFARDPNYPLGITVPALVDVPTGQVATNDFAQLTLDLSQSGSASAVVEAALAEFGKVDVLVNNAGIIRRAPAHRPRSALGSSSPSVSDCS